MGTIGELYMMFWTNPGRNSLQNSSCSATYLPSHKPSKTNKTCWAQLEKKEQAHKQCSLMDSYTWTHQYWLTSKDLHTSALCGHRMQFRRPAKSDRWQRQMVRENQGTLCYGFLIRINGTCLEEVWPLYITTEIPSTSDSGQVTNKQPKQKNV